MSTMVINAIPNPDSKLAQLLLHVCLKCNHNWLTSWYNGHESDPLPDAKEQRSG
jgi:hypothetical protein